MAVIVTGVVLALTSVGCDSREGRDRERYVIKERAPFYEAEVAYDPAAVDAVVNAVRLFADRHQMDFLVARRSLGPGEFNASANGPSINLKAIHVDSFGSRIKIFAISRQEPTAQERALVAEFVADISAQIAQSSQP